MKKKILMTILLVVSGVAIALQVSASQTQNNKYNFYGFSVSRKPVKVVVSRMFFRSDYTELIRYSDGSFVRQPIDPKDIE